VFRIDLTNGHLDPLTTRPSHDLGFSNQWIELNTVDNDFGVTSYSYVNVNWFNPGFDTTQSYWATYPLEFPIGLNPAPRFYPDSPGLFLFDNPTGPIDWIAFTPRVGTLVPNQAGLDIASEQVFVASVPQYVYPAYDGYDQFHPRAGRDASGVKRLAIR